MRKAFYRLYNRIQAFLAPGLRNSQFPYRESLERCVRPGIDWLDLGCGHQLLPDWMPSSEDLEANLLARCRRFVGIDADAPSLRKNRLARCLVAGNIESLPFPDASFDLVTANMVVEHVAKPVDLLREVHRVLKPEGQFLFHTPNSRGYTTLTARLLPDKAKIWLVRFLQGRKSGDIFPTFYRLNSHRSVAEVAAACGFEFQEIAFEESSAQTVMLGPLVVPELLLIRVLRWKPLGAFRTNLIVTLRKPANPRAA